MVQTLLFLLLLLSAGLSIEACADNPMSEDRSISTLSTTDTIDSPAQKSRTASLEMAIHHSPIAGSWYPSDPSQLKKLLRGYLEKAPPAEASQAAQLIALIAPHAGFLYSGFAAAHGYKVLQEKKPRRIILIAPSHYSSFHGISFGDYQAYRTPLGDLPVDPAGRALMDASPLINFHKKAHLKEHSLDIQIPFLQILFPDSPPSIIPLLAGRLKESDYPVLARCLRPFLNSETVIIISSDFTHYGPQFSYLPFPFNERVSLNLKNLDDSCLKKISSLDRKNFLNFVKDTNVTICGRLPIALLLEILPKDSLPKQLFYDTSGNITGDYKNSVSYFSIAFFNQLLWAFNTKEYNSDQSGHNHMTNESTPSERTGKDAQQLSEDDKETLLRLARDTLKTHFSREKSPKYLLEKYPITSKLKEERGAFVTLEKNGRLRGCIGYIRPVSSLYDAVRENTINAATRDTRFPRVRADELSEIHIEISALSRPVTLSSYKEIEIGKHGIILKRRGRQAVFLPQVAPEQGWDLPETLRHLSLKAGLAADAWKDPKTEFSVFIAEVFHEP